MLKVLRAFKQKAQELFRKDKQQEINLDQILFPAIGRIAEHEAEQQSILEKYVLLPADECRGNYIFVCKNLYIKHCIHALSAAPEYQKQEVSPADILTTLLQEISGRIHHLHFSLLLQQGDPYFYTLPKPHKTPIGWRPVAATHRSVFSNLKGLFLNA